MTTLQHQTLARLRAEAEARLNANRIAAEREQRRLAKRHSDIAAAGDFLVGLISGIGLSALIVLSVWSLL